MALRKIQRKINSDQPHMVGDGFRVHTFFPSESISIKRLSPFLLMDYNAPIEFTPREEPRGVGVHPHRGFETVTIVYSGSVAHHDSAGNSGVLHPGEVQWMTAGSGILHKEYHEKEFSKRGGLFHVVQLWVNLPSADKGARPKYQKLTHENLGYYNLPHKMGKVEVIAGQFKDVKGPAHTYTKMNLMNFKLEKGAEISFESNERWNTAALIIEGQAYINGNSADSGNLILFENIGETIDIKAIESSTILFLSGNPIDEKIAAYGPFVMNTHEELELALKDYNAGKYGILKE